MMIGSMDWVLMSTDHWVWDTTSGCGKDRNGQLGQGSDSNKYKKPMIIQINDNNDLISDVSCGSYHTLVLTHKNEVYGWGCNDFGQIGSRDTTCESITKPEKIKFNENYCIKSVHCFDNSSFALTSDGQVFSWGRNRCNQLGLNCNNLMICRPQLICNLSGITSIQSGAGKTYFSSDYKNKVYICGDYYNENNVIDIQMTPKLLGNCNEFSDIQSIKSYKWNERTFMCSMDDMYN
ncbi:RCC1 and BTB domain-containing protein 2-like [Oppia nitens]|uniref:RCC1 and BTB domain-containing protein 2-like n=1 Tax=Oppia nitens TaxID=1686743 RepID=UPI0023D9871D|nr:RCC1 and BTB domain-containing protein 2-like [Oppia nitens]